MTNDQRLGVPTETDPDDDAIDVLEIVTLFVLQWRLFLAVTLVLFAVGTAIVYAIKPEYQADATLLPQGKSENTDLSTFFSQHSASDVYVGLLASRSLQDHVIDQLDLMKLYHLKSREAARGTLASRSKFLAGRDTFLTIVVRDTDANRAAQIANAYLDALEALQDQMAAQSADLRSRFLNQQLAHESDALSAAEQDLTLLERRTGVIAPEQQTSIGISTIAQVRGQITQRQVELSSLLLGESDANPEVKAVRAQIAQLEAQEHALESSSGAGGAGAAAAASRMPALNLEIARKQRVVKFHEALLASLSNQLETARLAEGLSGLPFVVVDRAVAPESQAWPPRKPLMGLVAACSLLAGFLAVGLWLLWKRLTSLPGNAGRLGRIRQSFTFSGPRR